MDDSAKEPKKHRAKPGTRRVTITLPEAEYNSLAKLAESHMREPNNMLSYMLKSRIEGMLDDYAE